MMNNDKMLHTLFSHAEAADRDLLEHCRTLSGPELDEAGKVLDARCDALDALLADLLYQ